MSFIMILLIWSSMIILSLYIIIWHITSSLTKIMNIPYMNILYHPGWWFGTLFIFPCIGNNHPNWLICFFQRGSNHQPVSYSYHRTWICHKTFTETVVNLETSPGWNTEVPAPFASQSQWWEVPSDGAGVSRMDLPSKPGNHWVFYREIIPSG